MPKLEEQLDRIINKLDQLMIVAIESNKISSMISAQIESVFETIEIQAISDDSDSQDDEPWNNSGENENPPFE